METDFSIVAQQMAEGEPLIQVGSLGFFGWTERPDGVEVGIFKDMIFGTGGTLRVDAWKDAANGNVARFSEESAQNGIDLAQQALALRSEM